MRTARLRAPVARFLVPLSSLGLVLGVLAVAGALEADPPCGDGSACTPYTTGTPGVNLAFGCAPQTCADVCASTGGPPNPPPPQGTTGVMTCKCGDTDLIIPCSRKVHWTRALSNYTIQIMDCGEMPCSFGTCVVREPCVDVPGAWCSCTGL